MNNFGTITCLKYRKRKQITLIKTKQIDKSLQCLCDYWYLEVMLNGSLKSSVDVSFNVADD